MDLLLVTRIKEKVNHINDDTLSMLVDMQLKRSEYYKAKIATAYNIIQHRHFTMDYINHLLFISDIVNDYEKIQS